MSRKGNSLALVLMCSAWFTVAGEFTPAQNLVIIDGRNHNDVELVASYDSLLGKLASRCGATKEEIADWTTVGWRRIHDAGEKKTCKYFLISLIEATEDMGRKYTVAGKKQFCIEAAGMLTLLMD